jgi:hypothetical protein
MKVNTMQVNNSIVWILEGLEHEPFMMVRHCHPDWGCVNGIPERLDYKRLSNFKAAGFTIDDPHSLVTCRCGEFKHWVFIECDACHAETMDAKDDVQMYHDLAHGL